MLDLTLLKAALDAVAAILGPVLLRTEDVRQRWRVAVAGLQKAVLDTQSCVAALERGEVTNLQTETHLVGLWREAATGFYGLDGALAERLQLKASYWTEPAAWTDQQVRDTGISLQHVAEYARQLLREGPGRDA